MLHTRYIIQMKIPSRPDLNYYYRGQNKEGCNVFVLTKTNAKRYYFIEEAYRALSILSVIERDESLTVVPIKCRT